MKNLLLIWNGTTAESHGKGAGKIGGGDQVILKFVDRSGLEPDFIVPSSAASLISHSRRLFFTRRNMAGGGLLGFLYLIAVRTLHAIWIALRIRGNNYDLAIATSPFVFDLVPLIFCKAKQKGAIVYHVIPERKALNFATRVRFTLAALESKISLRLIRWVCDFIITGNDHAKRQLEEIAPGKPVVILHAGFNTAILDRIPDQIKNPNQACFLGRLTSQKGIFDLVEVMDRISRVAPEFRLIIMGSGPEREALAAAIKQRNLTSIELKGFVSDEEKYTLMKQSGFFFFPSYEEGWGIALAEAIYCGCKAVTYELPHYRSVFGEHPIYVELGNAAQFADRLLANRHAVASPAQKTLMAEYDDDAVVRQLVKHMERFSGSQA